MAEQARASGVKGHPGCWPALPPHGWRRSTGLRSASGTSATQGEDHAGPCSEAQCSAAQVRTLTTLAPQPEHTPRYTSARQLPSALAGSLALSSAHQRDPAPLGPSSAPASPASMAITWAALCVQPALVGARVVAGAAVAGAAAAVMVTGSSSRL